MKGSEKYYDASVLAAILLLAALLRFYHFSSWSLTNDELSAITRLNFPTLGELLANGVRPDFHPAGVQVFLYYWTKLFGNDVWAVRLPFVLCGIASVYYIYLVAKRWFNLNTAHLSALTLACLSYLVLYSQLARPYSPGLLFSLMMVHHWNGILFEEKVKTRHLLGYALATSLCMYTHYFCFFFAVMVGITGVIFIRKENLKPYFIAALSGAALFLPHLGITLEQLSRGGVGTWLGKPDSDFMRDYIHYAFNESSALVTAFSVLAILSVLMNAGTVRFNRFRVISFAWFIIPFIFGYYYSIYKNPVLQYSVLIFSFPFLLIFIHSFYCERVNFSRIAVLVFCGAAMLYTGIVVQKFYTQKPFGVFKELCEKKTEWDKKYGRENIATSFNAVAPAYLEYYFSKNNYKADYTFARGDEEQFPGKVLQALAAGKPYFIYGWTNMDCPPLAYELIRFNYPEITEDFVYFNSRITLFRMAPPGTRKKFCSSIQDFESPGPGWQYDSLKIVRDENNNRLLRIDSSTEFSAGFSGTLAGWCMDSVKYLNVSASIIPMYDNTNIHLVLEFHKAGNDELYGWQSVQSKNFLTPGGKVSRLLLTAKIPPSYKKGDRIAVYMWNPEKKTVLVDAMEIFSFADMHYEPKLDFK